MFARFRMLTKYNWLVPRPNLYTSLAGRPCYVLQSRPKVLWRFLQKQTVEQPNTLKLMWNKMFTKYLLATNTITSGLLMMVGDFGAQEIQYFQTLKKENRYDYKRLGRMFIVGCLLGPLHHYVYNWMERILPARSTKHVLRKILLDQFIMGPTCILIFFYSACYFEMKSVQQTNKELIAKFPIIYTIDWMTWPIAQYINFSYLNVKYRVFYVNAVTAVYNVFLSYIKHSLHWDI